jgi:hypothetical protein
MHRNWTSDASSTYAQPKTQARVDETYIEVKGDRKGVDFWAVLKGLLTARGSFQSNLQLLRTLYYLRRSRLVNSARHKGRV